VIFFGEGCLLTPDRRSLAAHCLSPITVSAFRPSELLDRVQQDRRFASRILKNLALRLDRRPEISVRREGLREYLEATASNDLRPRQRRGPQIQEQRL